MATETNSGPGLKKRSISDSAGIRPWQLDITYASTTTYLAGKSASGYNSSSAQEGDWFYDTTDNVIKYYDGSSWNGISVTALGSALTTGSIWIGAASVAAELDIKGDGKILVGNGTTATSVAVSGDATLANTGALTIAAGAVEDSMVEALAQGEFIIGVDGTAANNTKATFSGDVTATVTATDCALAIGAVVDGAHTSNTVTENTTGAVEVVYMFTIAGGAAGNQDITIDRKTLITDAWAIHTGGAGESSDTIQVTNAGSAITDAMDWSGADTVLVRAGQINDANSTVNAAGTLRVTTVDADVGGDVGAGIVFVRGIHVA